MLRSTLLKAGRLAAALGPQPLHHPSGSVLAGSQVQYRLRVLGCQAHETPGIQCLFCALQCALRDFSTNSHDIFNVVSVVVPIWSAVPNISVIVVFGPCADTSPNPCELAAAQTRC